MVALWRAPRASPRPLGAEFMASVKKAVLKDRVRPNPVGLTGLLASRHRVGVAVPSLSARKEERREAQW